MQKSKKNRAILFVFSKYFC